MAVLIDTAGRGATRHRSWSNALVGALTLVLGVVLSAPAASDFRSKEYPIKGALLFHFLQFVSWPEDSHEGPDTPFIIGILGKDPFGEILDAVVRSEKVENRKVEVKRFSSPSEVGQCHILFVCQSEKDRWEVIAGSLKAKPVLTVADFDGFVRRKGMIEFYTSEEERVRLRINLEAARAASIRISARLLRVAEVITEGGS